MKKDFFTKTKGKLIVSCQALSNEPLYSSFIMGRMAYAAKLGGASAIRANSVVDIKEIKKTTNLPIIGIIKEDYDDSPVFITPTRKEIDDLIKEKVDVIAMDATDRIRPNGKNLEDFFIEIRKDYPNQIFMADCSNIEEAIFAEKIGFDIVSTTLCGYTQYTEGTKLPNYKLINDMIEKINTTIIVEGGIWEREDFVKIMNMDKIHSVVIGGAITRPMEITQYYLDGLK